MIATPPAMTGDAFLGEPREADVVDAAASISASRRRVTALALMPCSHQPLACTMLPIARAVPDEPIASPQPR